MNSEIAAARSHPAVVIAMVVAAVAVTACALVAMAYMLGWVPVRTTAPSPVSMAIPGQQVAGTVDGVALLPGETLVTPADAPQPATPAYAGMSKAPVPSPAPAAMPGAASAPVTPQYSKAELAARKPTAMPAAPPPAPSPSSSYAQGLPSRAAPSKPSYTRPEPPVTAYERSTRSLCINCGSIASIGSNGDDWEVRVRFEDGTTESIRYPDRPRLSVGQRVTLEDGRLIPE
jgi:hypothetical protein